VPRSAVGVVNEAGEIIDKDGKAIGKVADSKDLQSLAGNTVTAAGDVLNSTGDIVGKATDEEYTTTDQDGKKSGGGFFSGAKGVFNTVSGLRKPVTDGVGFIRGQQQKAEDSQSNAHTPAEDEGATEAGSEVPQDAASVAQNTEGQDIPDDAVSQAQTADDQGVPDDVASQAQTTEAQDLPEDARSQAQNTDAQDLADDARSQAQTTEAQDLPDDARSQAQNTEVQDLPEDQQTQGDLQEQEPIQIEERDGEQPLDGADNNDQGGDDEKSKAGDKADDLTSQIRDDATNADTDAPKVDDATVPEAGEEAQEKTDEAAAKADDAAVPEAGEEAQEKTDEAAAQADDAVPEAGEEAKEAVDEEQPKLDLSALKGTKVNKLGKLVNDNGDTIGRIVEGDVKHLQGKKCDEEGNIWDDSGKIVGKAELIPESELDKKAFAPFENFPDAVVEADGRVVCNGQQVGKVIEGDAKHLKGSRVDEDGDILDRRGNVVGKAEAWDEPEAIPEEKVDNSQLAGKRVNKAGYVVDSSGVIWGRVVEGNVSAIIGRMCDKEGNVRSESGDIVGKAELVPEGEREGSREGPFTDLPGCTVAKDGKVVTAAGDVIGRLVKGDAKTLFGRSVDDDGDVLDRNGNVIGKAERWEEPEKKKDPMTGRKVNKDGNVLDDDGSVIGKLVSGDVLVCAGKEIDDDGDVINSKGNTVGHVALLQDIPEPEVGESPEEKEEREQAEKDKKLAQQLASSIEGSLDKIKPILKMITDKIDRAERTPKEELDEEDLVKQVKPLIEEGGKILTETNGVIRGLDPDGRIQRNAKHKSSTKEASAEEHHLAEVLKEVRLGPKYTCIDQIANPSSSSPAPSLKPLITPSARLKACRMPRRSSTRSGVFSPIPCSRS
jgi:hypothetical protein